MERFPGLCFGLLPVSHPQHVCGLVRANLCLDIVSGLCRISHTRQRSACQQEALEPETEEDASQETLENSLFRTGSCAMVLCA